MGAWVFYCLSSGGSGGSSQFYAAAPADGAPVLRHNQAANGGDPGHAGDSSGMRYGVLWPTANHPSSAYYGSMIHWDKSQSGVKGIIASTDKNNVAAWAVLEKNGFVKCGETETLFNWRLDLG